MFNNNIHKHFYYHIQSLSRTRSCLTSLQVVHNPLLVCVHFVAFFFLQAQFPWLLPRGNQIFVWFGLNICVNNLNNRSSLISTTVEENLTCSAEAAWQTSSNVSVDVATENEEMGGREIFPVSGLAGEEEDEEKNKKQPKNRKKLAPDWNKMKTATKQISANFKRPPKLRNAVQDKNGPRARWPRKVGGGGNFSPYTTQWKFPQRLREGVAFYFTLSASSSMSSLVSASASLFLDLLQRKLCERRETASSEAN